MQNLKNYYQEQYRKQRQVAQVSQFRNRLDALFEPEEEVGTRRAKITQLQDEQLSDRSLDLEEIARNPPVRQAPIDPAKAEYRDMLWNYYRHDPLRFQEVAHEIRKRGYENFELETVADSEAELQLSKLSLESLGSRKAAFQQPQPTLEAASRKAVDEAQLSIRSQLTAKSRDGRPVGDLTAQQKSALAHEVASTFRIDEAIQQLRQQQQLHPASRQSEKDFTRILDASLIESERSRRPPSDVSAT